MGHTHYKLLKKFENGGIMINPGSVGQPRVIGDKPSFVIFDTLNNSTNFIEIDYDVASVIAKLEEINGIQEQ
jgi:predicted phosphodiesterase